MDRSKDPAAWVESIVKEFIRESPENTLQYKGDEKAFEEVLVGFSRGDDPVFAAYKEHVGEFHWTPAEAFNLGFPEEKASPEELTVISWILAQTPATKADNRKMDVYPAERWARARIFGEEVNAKLRKRVVQVLKENGYQAVAPSLLPD